MIKNSVTGGKSIIFKVSKAELSTLLKYRLLAAAVIYCCGSKVSKAGPLKSS